MSIGTPAENMLASLRYAQSVYGISDAAKEYQRRHTVTYTDPAPEQWQAYHEAEAHLEALYKYDGFYAGHDGPELDKPQRARHIEYTETESEWLTRANALTLANGGLPDDIDQVLSISQLKALGVDPRCRPRHWGKPSEYNQGGPMQAIPPPSAEAPCARHRPPRIASTPTT